MGEEMMRRAIELSQLEEENSKKKIDDEEEEMIK